MWICLMLSIRKTNYLCVSSEMKTFIIIHSSSSQNVFVFHSIHVHSFFLSKFDHILLLMLLLILFFWISVNEHSEKTRACNYLHRMLIWLDYRVIINALHEYAMTLESLRYIKWMQIDRLKKTIKSLWLNKKTFTFLPLFVMRKKSIERINHTSRIDE